MAVGAKQRLVEVGDGQQDEAVVAGGLVELSRSCRGWWPGADRAGVSWPSQEFQTEVTLGVWWSRHLAVCSSVLIQVDYF